MKHLTNLAAKIAAKKAKRALRKPGQGALTGDRYSTAMIYARPTRSARQADHAKKMRDLKNWFPRPDSLSRVGIPASINRHTGKPHEHAREIARNIARSTPRDDRDIGGGL